MIALYTLNYYEECHEDKCLLAFLHALSTKQEYIITSRIPNYMYNQDIND